jgi:hypothetical protein
MGGEEGDGRLTWKRAQPSRQLVGFESSSHPSNIRKWTADAKELPTQSVQSNILSEWNWGDSPSRCRCCREPRLSFPPSAAAAASFQRTAWLPTLFTPNSLSINYVGGGGGSPLRRRDSAHQRRGELQLRKIYTVNEQHSTAHTITLPDGSQIQKVFKHKVRALESLIMNKS